MEPESTLSALPSRGLNPFNYSLAETQKAIIALVGFLGFAAFYMIKVKFDPALIPAIETLVPTGFAVIAVFAAKNHTPDDLLKPLLGFIAAGAGVYKFFGTIDPGTLETLAVFAGYIVTFVGVYWRGNTTEPPPPVTTAASTIISATAEKPERPPGPPPVIPET